MIIKSLKVKVLGLFLKNLSISPSIVSNSEDVFFVLRIGRIV